MERVDSIWRSCHIILIHLWRPMFFLFLRWWVGLGWRSLPTGSRVGEQGFFFLREMIYAWKEDQMREIIWFSLSSMFVADHESSEWKTRRTSSIAHFISLANILYIGGTTWMGILTNRSHSTRPTCASDWENKAFKVSWKAVSWAEVTERR